MLELKVFEVRCVYMVLIAEHVLSDLEIGVLSIFRYNRDILEKK